MAALSVYSFKEKLVLAGEIGGDPKKMQMPVLLENIV